MPRNVKRAVSRARDEAQQAELSAFVNSLASAAGYKTTADWARDSGYPAPNLSNLRNGRGGVDGYNLLRLIRAAASRVDVAAGELAVTVAAATSAATIADRLDQLAALVSEALDRLGEHIPGGMVDNVALAEQLLRRLDEGEHVPADQIGRLVAQLQETSRLSVQMARRLREAGAAEDSGR